MVKDDTLLISETDRALDDVSADEYGFNDIARKLAPSLVDAAKSDGMVIGIEGPWGSGKTSLLNFLKKQLASEQANQLHVITLAPWLTGDNISLIESLTEAMADILDKEEEKSNPSGFWSRGKKQSAGYTDLFRKYGARTGRALAPLANLAGMIYPPAAIVGAGLGVGADYLEKLGRNPTDAEVKKLISDKLASLDVRFLVLIDDLDRLEPQQAVEVIRMVRSVADFPKVAYVMCYDRSVLAHALERGLHVKDGDLFLQKVVQLTFTIPLPEPFDLRLSLRSKVLAVYREVNRKDPEVEERDQISRAIDREGAGLKTPREVKLVLNAIKFAYRNMADDLYFPDLCRISLLKILNPPLYRWLENYLSVRSVIFTGDAELSEDDVTEMGASLKELLPSEAMGSTRSIWSAAEYIPGLQNDDDPKDRVFQSEHSSQISKYLSDKRLGSPVHYRYYFALTGPRSALPDEKLNELKELAGSDVQGLSTKLEGYIVAPRPLGQSWFEHILDRFSAPELGALSVDQLCGIATALGNVMDIAMKGKKQVRFFSRSLSDKAEILMGNILDILREKDAQTRSGLLKQIFTQGPSLNWFVAEFFRRELFDHGVVGDRAKRVEDRHLTADELDTYRQELKQRLSAAAADGSLASYPELGSILYGWRDMAGIEEPRTWVASFIADDANFLTLLLELRGLAVSDRVYRPLRKSTLELFMDWEVVQPRLEALRQNNPSSQVKLELDEIDEALRFGEGDHFN
ncbi:KAP family NTPase [Phyllobacterium zundukense]|uniref:KAP family NTPase n=1 Tax=Phyllobacterium zundukense TaxID=1867719 RepID=A0ACD4CWX7_9HYPH|nr:KAP family NTPase [Phyllobacterium zundukense]UXN58118.1 KAP family NTPase [Phyllobacterium zundukense]